MDIATALRARHATRAFTSNPVDLSLVRQLLDTAKHSPSGGNLQPWIVHVIVGSALEALVADVSSRLERGEREKAEYAIYPPHLWEPLRSRRYRAGEQRYSALGGTRESGAQLELERRNLRFFDAPVGLFFCVDRRAGPPQWADVGMFMQSFMLLAVEQGLASCPQEVWANWPETVGHHLGLSDSVMLFAGMSLGYADDASAMNAYRTERAGVDAFATFHVDRG